MSREQHSFPGLPRRLRAARVKLGLTQLQVAQRTGRGHMAISRYECGRLVPSCAAIVALARALGVTTDHLLGLNPDAGPVVRCCDMLNEPVCDWVCSIPHGSPPSALQSRLILQSRTGLEKVQMKPRKCPTLGAKVRKARLMRGWSQERLGLEVGLVQSSIKDIEAGFNWPSVRVLAGLCSTLSVSADWILAGCAKEQE